MGLEIYPFFNIFLAAGLGGGALVVGIGGSDLLTPLVQVLVGRFPSALLCRLPKIANESFTIASRLITEPGDRS